MWTLTPLGMTRALPPPPPLLNHGDILPLDLPASPVAAPIQTVPHFMSPRFARGPSGPPMDGIKTPAAQSAPPGAPGPHTPPAQHTPSAARWLPPYRKCHLLDSQSPAQMALRRLPYAGHLTSSGTAQACSTRISPARRPQTARAHTASGPTFRTGRLGTSSRIGNGYNVLVGP